MTLSPPLSARRRQLLQLLALGALAPLVACSWRPNMNGTFVQLWRSHLTLSRAEWRQRLTATRRLGCREIFLQWVGVTGGANGDWNAPDAFVEMIFDESERLGLGVHVGLPYDERWWKVLGMQDDLAVARYLDELGSRGVDYIASAPWPTRKGFRGWYIPYELEQYSWATPARQELLRPWLSAFSNASITHGGQIPAISTYHSRLQTEGSLVTLWQSILDAVLLRPMIQDGVGVAGIANYKALAPLHKMLLARGTPFDLILELFEEQSDAKSDGTEFKARSAPFSRVEQQFQIARGYGASRVVGFSIDPWVIGDTPEARALLKAWQWARL